MGREFPTPAPELASWKTEKEKAGFVNAIYIAGYPVNLFSHKPEFNPFSENQTPGYSYDIPGWRISDEPAEGFPSIVYLPGPNNSFEYIKETGTFIVRGPEEDYESGQAIAYISFWLSEAYREIHSIFTVHASAVALDGKGVLLFGDRGSGKTLVALNLIRQYGASFISNDLAVVRHDADNRRVLVQEGSGAIRVRQKVAKNYFPDLLKDFPEKVESPWLHEVVYTPESLGIKLSGLPVELVSAYELHIDAKEKELILARRLDGLEVQFRLYENLSRIIRGSAISVFGAKNGILGYMPSLDSLETHERRVGLINFLVREKGIWNVSGGNLGEVCEEIIQLAR